MRDRTLWLRGLVFGLLVVVCVYDVYGQEPSDEARARSTAVALNYSRASLHRIRQNPSVRVLMEEQEKILNNLNLDGVADEEVVKLYTSVLDEIGQVRIAERERAVFRDKYHQAFRRDLGVNAFLFATQMASAQFGQAARTGAGSWWDYRTMTVNRDLDLWRVDKQRMTAVLDKSSQFLDTSWKMARQQNIPDRWLVRGDDLDRLEDAWREPDAEVRLRILKRMEPFMECYPPYWYYVARSQQSLGQLFAAAQTYERLAGLGAGHFRKDDMLAAALANRAVIQAYLNQPSAAETAREALRYSTDVWEANLMCAQVLHRGGDPIAAEDALLRNLDVNAERPQSLASLLSLYCQSQQTQKLAARLNDPEDVRQVSVPVLLRCAAVLGEQTPSAVTNTLTASLLAAPRLGLGRDDFVLTASPAWQLGTAQVTMQWGGQAFHTPRLVAGRDNWVQARFDGIFDWGGPLATLPENLETSITVKYPDAGTVRLVLRHNTDGTRTASVGAIQAASASSTPRQSGVFRIASIELDGAQVALNGQRQRTSSPVVLLPPIDQPAAAELDTLLLE